METKTERKTEQKVNPVLERIRRLQAEKLAKIAQGNSQNNEHKHEPIQLKSEPEQPKPELNQPKKKETFLERVARLKREREAAQHEQSIVAANETTQTLNKTIPETPTADIPSAPADQAAVAKVLNTRQQQAIDFGLEGKSFVLTGAAGTGKTFTTCTLVRRLFRENNLPIVTFRDPAGNSNDQEAKPAIALCAFTNRAVNNMLTALQKFDEDLYDEAASNYMTLHKLLEYAPEYFDIQDEKTGEIKRTMRFVPKRDKFNKLPLRYLIVEEASMVDLELWRRVKSALPDDCTVIFLGDLNQLPPVFGDSILQLAVRDLPIIELDEVYRQALDSPIINAAYSILQKKTPQTKTNDTGTFQHIDPNKLLGQFKFAQYALKVLHRAYDAGKYNPYTDMVLTPFNKHDCGTVELNKDIASMLDRMKLADPETYPNFAVHEIIAGFNKHYLAEGDRVYVNKMEGVIKSITPNITYFGRRPQPASPNLNRWGVEQSITDDDNLNIDPDEFNLNLDTSITVNVDEIIAEVNNAKEDQNRVDAASHTITIELETGAETILSSAGEINNLSLGYALTTHKAQGCEFPNVFIIVHDSHRTVASNEWLYTSVTRASQNCYLIALEQTLTKVTQRKKIKGDTIQDKVEYFVQSLVKKLPTLEPERAALYNKHNIWTKQTLDQLNEDTTHGNM